MADMPLSIRRIMGYTTDFCGSLQITPTMTKAHVAYLQAFSDVRHMKLRVDKCEEAIASSTELTRADKLRRAVGLPIGDEGQYIVSDLEYAKPVAVVDINEPATGVPGLWCDWTITEDGEELVWNEDEKFYDYVEWLKYLVTHFIGPWGYTLNGQISWAGEDYSDSGVIYVKDNMIEEIPDEIIQRGPSWERVTTPPA